LSLATPRDAARVFEVRRERLVPVTEPLVLISQIQRSGGTLLSQLFDGHPQLHCHPHELQIGHPDKYTWPRLDPSRTADELFDVLSERPTRRLFEEGYRKYGTRPVLREEALPFALAPSFQQRLFRLLASQRELARDRDVLDCYLTSYFNAWLDNQNLWGAEKRWVIGFAPRLAWGDGRERLFEVYPDGRLISILRDPVHWYASARRHTPAWYGSVDAALVQWRRSAEEMLEAKRRHGRRVALIGFERLITETDRVMRWLAGWLAIEFDPCLTEPTFNRLPVRANSSFPVSAGGVLTAPLESWRSALSGEEVAAVEEPCRDLYERVRAVLDA
jgi:Sulfotransferase family